MTRSTWTRRILAGLFAGAVIGSAGGGLARSAGAAGLAGPAPVGYTTMLDESVDIVDSTCQLGRVDLEAGGPVDPVGPAFDLFADGCPFDLARRAGDERIWAVVEPLDLLLGSDASELDLPGPLGGPGPSGVPSPAVTPGSVPPGVSLSAATSAVLVTIDPATGVRTPVGPLGFNSLGFIFGDGLAFDAAGNLWFYGSSDDPACTAAIDLCLFKLDPDTGAATFVARGSLTTGPLLTLVVGATATCSAVLGTTLDFEDEEDAVSASLATVNTTNASLTRAPFPYGPNVFLYGIERDDAGTLRGIGFEPDATFTTAVFGTYRVDRTSGHATKVADLPTTEDQFFLGLVIGGVTCPAPPPPAPPPAPVTVTPTFTG